MELRWIKSTTNQWLSLEWVDLSGVNTTGVYIIWHGGNPSRVVRVGQGNITARLTAHRADREVLAYRVHGLYVTWATVPALFLDGVEAYLADTWNPILGERFPVAARIAVNSPFA